MNLLNFSHLLSKSALSDLEKAVGAPLEHVINLMPQFDARQPFMPQVVALLDTAGISSQQFQTEPWLVALPALNYIAALLLAELHGRIGHFPSIIRLRPTANGSVTTYEFAEILDLEQERQQARLRR